MKKLLAILLAVLCVFSCFAIGASAEEGDEPQLSPSGYYIGQELTPGEVITSEYETCESFMITYAIGSEDAAFVTSAQQKKYADPELTSVSVFRDIIASFTSGDYAGEYVIKNVGDEVGEMQVGIGSAYKTADDIMKGLEEKPKKDIVLTIDYDYARTTYYQYTTIVAWKIVDLDDTKTGLTMRVEAVFAVREPSGAESFVESIYASWCKFLDKIGDMLIKIIPKIFEIIAKMLGNK